MKLEKYGIELRRITINDIELLRQWRNSTAIQPYMNYRHYITPEMQEQWFRSIDNINNFYYIIWFEGRQVGLFNEKDIDWDTRTSETGMFIADPGLIDSHIPILVSLVLCQAGFYLLNGKATYARILRSNTRAVDFAKSFGYVLCQGEEELEHQKYILTRSYFETTAARLIAAADKIYKDKIVLQVTLEEPDKHNGVWQHIETIVENSPVPHEREDRDNSIIYRFP